jgi:hypothetical protein
MDGRSEFFVFMGAAIGTAVTLFLVQQVYASYIDVNVVHGKWADAPRDAKLAAMREAEQQALSGGKLPIKQAIEQLGQRGRGSSNKIAPLQSEDVSAMSGWAFQHGFKAYAPRKAAPAAAAVPPEGTVPAEGAAPVEGAAPTEGAAPAAQPAAPAPAAAPAAPTAAPAHAGHAH